jgi:hypothetical protein
LLASLVAVSGDPIVSCGIFLGEYVVANKGKFVKLGHRRLPSLGGCAHVVVLLGVRRLFYGSKDLAQVLFDVEPRSDRVPA